MRRQSTAGRKFDRTFRNPSYPVVGALAIVMLAPVSLLVGAVFGIGGFADGNIALGIGAFVIGLIAAGACVWAGLRAYILTFVGVDRHGIFVRNPLRDVDIPWDAFAGAEEALSGLRSWMLRIHRTTGESVDVFCVQSANGAKLTGNAGYAERVADEINGLASTYTDGSLLESAPDVAGTQAVTGGGGESRPQGFRRVFYGPSVKRVQVGSLVGALGAAIVIGLATFLFLSVTPIIVLPVVLLAATSMGKVATERLRRQFVGVSHQGVYVRNVSGAVDIPWDEFVAAEAVSADAPPAAGTGASSLLVIRRTTGQPVIVEWMTAGRFSSRARAERHAEQVADEINGSAAAYRSSGLGPPQ